MNPAIHFVHGRFVDRDMVMRYLPGEAPGHQGTIPTKRRRAQTVTSRTSGDDATDDAGDDDVAALNVSLADRVQAGDALEDQDDGGDEDGGLDEEFDDEYRSDLDEDSGEAAGGEGWVDDEDGDLGPEDGEAVEDDGYDEHYAPF